MRCCVTRHIDLVIIICMIVQLFLLAVSLWVPFTEKLSGALWGSEAPRSFCPHSLEAKLQPLWLSMSSKGWISWLFLPWPEARLKGAEKPSRLQTDHLGWDQGGENSAYNLIFSETPFLNSHHKNPHQIFWVWYT